MKRFIISTLSIIIVIILINTVLIVAIPHDNNAYLCEYNHKVELIEKVESPRIIFVGGSSIAFGNDSKTIADSLGMNVINFGLHAGIGFRYPAEDCLQYVKKNDIFVFQIEYGNFLNGGFGSDALQGLAISTNWRNFSSLYPQQYVNIFTGMPDIAYGQLKRLIKYPIKKTFDTPTESPVYQYAKSNFNEFGDECRHWDISNIKYCPNKTSVKDKHVDAGFLEWLQSIIEQYESEGAKVIIMPPVCPISNFNNSNKADIELALQQIGRPYVVAPTEMTVADSCGYDTGYHVNKEGVKQNSQKIINILKSQLL